MQNQQSIEGTCFNFVDVAWTHPAQLEVCFSERQSFSGKSFCSRNHEEECKKLSEHNIRVGGGGGGGGSRVLCAFWCPRYSWLSCSCGRLAPRISCILPPRIPEQKRGCSQSRLLGKALFVFFILAVKEKPVKSFSRVTDPLGLFWTENCLPLLGLIRPKLLLTFHG